MERVRLFRALALSAMMAVSGLSLAAQTGDPGTLDQQKLIAQIKLTKPTDDHSDIVTAGDTVLLRKDGLMMCSSNSSYAFSNSYTNGVLAANYNNRAKDAARSLFRTFGGSVAQSANNACASRKFVAGEKFWVTRVDLLKDGILVSTFSDPYPDASGNQVRYYGEIKFPFPKGQVPGPDDFVKTVSEVITVQPPDNSQGDQGSAPPPPPGPAAPPPAPMAPIAPPPPPADAAPATIAVGQTEAQVTTAFGQPVKQANLGTKKIYYYKDMKVTFVHGKVTDVQ
jgi:hypothetical protein